MDLYPRTTSSPRWTRSIPATSKILFFSVWTPKYAFLQFVGENSLRADFPIQAKLLDERRSVEVSKKAQKKGLGSHFESYLVVQGASHLCPARSACTNHFKCFVCMFASFLNFSLGKLFLIKQGGLQLGEPWWSPLYVFQHQRGEPWRKKALDARSLVVGNFLLLDL